MSFEISEPTEREDDEARHSPLEKPTLSAIIGLRLRGLRKLRGMTLKDVAVKADTTPQSIQRLETNNMTLSLDWVEKMLFALNCEPSDLFDQHGMERVYEDALQHARAGTVAELRAFADALEKGYRK